jgi:hypothetical protein
MLTLVCESWPDVSLLLTQGDVVAAVDTPTSRDVGYAAIDKYITARLTKEEHSDLMAQERIVSDIDMHECSR